jgi:kinesin family protein C1
MIEIYNEDVKDLLVSQKVSAETKYDVKHHPDGRTTVTGLKTVEVANAGEVAKLMKKAQAFRSTAKTNMNEHSSRSHMVFTLHLDGVDAAGQPLHGALNLVDLAGSERLSRTGAEGARLKEAQNINKSLSALGDVVLALANKDAHVPFRNSKLTYLLQNSLGGDSKTLMFVNVSPAADSSQETLCSLRFAAKVNACQSNQIAGKK